ncbi:hypothetical protein C5167_009864 [Papaver somniferum]|uniref:rRNA methylase YtqB n=1 Tax=Papaver somniferum TaxID=3469 RepID=A0A4Y7JYJ9_PAPSO|nr:uncharacterized protein LOC113285899 [Papaver somniferum]RZC66174.1 hypothetical protein C5167_009864 [Papaver somniferum]
MFLSLRSYSQFISINRQTLNNSPFLMNLIPFPRNCSILPRRCPRSHSFCTKSLVQSHQDAFPLSGLEDALMGYITGKKKATELAHLIWQRIVQKGDYVVDATCGNGYDTLALLKMVADESGKGRVYGMDIQSCALKNTSSLLDESLNTNERELVELFHLCHSRMEDVISEGIFLRLVVFNLGYLPGGDKAIITVPEKTSQALESACRLMGPGGLISVMVYVGHPGGREEYETIQSFASGLPSESWVCCKFEMLNRPLAPVLVLLFKK